MSDEYWFARRFPLGSPRAGMTPVHWKGHAMVAIYVFVLLAGGGALVWFGANGNVPEGLAFFLMAAFMGTIFFISVSRQKGDRIRTVADYKKDQTRV